MNEPVHLLDFTNVIILCVTFLACLYIIGHLLDDGDDYEDIVRKRDD